MATTFVNAFGDCIFPKIAQGFSADADLEALKATAALAADPENIVKLLGEDIFNAIVDRLSHDTAEIRQLAIESISLISGIRQGREHCLKSGISARVINLLADRDVSVRRFAYATINNICDTPKGLDECIILGAVTTLIDRMQAETEPELQVAALRTIRRCISSSKDGFKSAADSNLISTVTILIQHKNSTVRALACECLANLIIPFSSKQACVAAEGVRALQQCLQDEDQQIRIFASRALMHATVTNDGKQQGLDADLIADLLNIIQRMDEHPSCKENSLQILANLATHPVGKTTLCASMELFQKFSKSTDIGISTAAGSVVEILVWVP